MHKKRLLRWPPPRRAFSSSTIAGARMHKRRAPAGLEGVASRLAKATSRSCKRSTTTTLEALTLMIERSLRGWRRHFVRERTCLQNFSECRMRKPWNAHLTRSQRANRARGRDRVHHDNATRLTRARSESRAPRNQRTNRASHACVARSGVRSQQTSNGSQ
jgi:hypothetical protein